MCRITLLAALAAASFAQSAPKPPAEVDAALRARIQEFYQYHVSEEYRKAEKLVAEDSQDIYYVASKPHYLSFEIRSIEYLDNFTRAKVSVQCEQFMHGVGFQGQKVKSPSTSTWKDVDGKWFWYVDKDELAKGPFGKSANAGTKAGAGAAPDINQPVNLGAVKLEKDTLEAKPHTTQQVKIKNETPGTVSLVLHQRLPGWEVTLDKANLNPGETAVATFKAEENPFSGEIQFMVNPFGYLLTLQAKR
jgi:hypothetical protein